MSSQVLSDSNIRRRVLAAPARALEPQPRAVRTPDHRARADDQRLRGAPSPGPCRRARPQARRPRRAADADALGRDAAPRRARARRLGDEGRVRVRRARDLRRAHRGGPRAARVAPAAPTSPRSARSSRSGSRPTSSSTLVDLLGRLPGRPVTASPAPRSSSLVTAGLRAWREQRPRRRREPQRLLRRRRLRAHSATATSTSSRTGSAGKSFVACSVTKRASASPGTGSAEIVTQSSPSRSGAPAE